MHLSQSGDAAMGYAEISINGVIPAALTGHVGGSRTGPGWLNANEIVFQDGGVAGAGPWVFKKYNKSTLALTTIDSSGLNDCAAGNNIYAAWLNGTGVRTNDGHAPFPTARLGDVSPDFGELVTIDTYPNSIGLSVYDSSGAKIYGDQSVVFTADDLVRIRGHICAFQNNGNWQMVNVVGDPLVYKVRVDDQVAWITPLVLASGKVLMLELSNRLTLRYAQNGMGWIIAAPGEATFNPDLIEISADIVRMGWSSNSGESHDALVLFELNVSTNSARKAVVNAGVINWVTQDPLVPTQFLVGPPQGLSGSKLPMPRYDENVLSKDGKFTKSWYQYLGQNNQAVASASQVAQSASSAAAAASNQPAYVGVNSSGQSGLLAVGATTLNVEADTGATVTLVPATQTVKIGVSGSGVAGLTIPGVPGLDGDDGIAFVIPGPQGPPGATGPAGASGAGVPGPPGMDGDDDAWGLSVIPPTPIVLAASQILGRGSANGVGIAEPIVPDGTTVQITGTTLSVVAGGGSGLVAQVVATETGAASTGTTTIPFDDTIPQNTEGDEYLTQAITPGNSSSLLLIEAVIFATATTTPWITVALFQDSTANALAAIATFNPVNTAGGAIILKHKMTAGTTSSTTFKIRIGVTSGTLTFNGQSGGRIFGGVMASSLTITEIRP